jgi:protein translocase SecG subunit
MQFVGSILPYIEIVISVILVVSIVLQQSGANVGGALGGGEGSFHATRRGFEKFLFYLSIICAVLFALSAFLSIWIKKGL